MRVALINDNNLTYDDVSEYRRKARAILIKDGMILVSRYGGVTLLPGGSIEGTELPVCAMIRELKEETGVDYLASDLNNIMTLRYFQPDYPTREGATCNRYVYTEFFLGEYKEPDLSNVSRSDKELKDNFHLELISIEDFRKSVQEDTGNPRKKFFDRENEEVISLIDTLEKHRNGR